MKFGGRGMCVGKFRSLLFTVNSKLFSNEGDEWSIWDVVSPVNWRSWSFFFKARMLVTLRVELSAKEKMKYWSDIARNRRRRSRCKIVLVLYLCLPLVRMTLGYPEMGFFWIGGGDGRIVRGRKYVLKNTIFYDGSVKNL